MILRSLFSALLFLLPLHAEQAVPPAVPPLEAATSNDHPFLDRSGPPRWSKMTPEQLRIDAETAFQATLNNYRAIEQVTEPTYENTFGRLDANLPLVNVCLCMQLLSATSDSPEQRAAAQEVFDKIVLCDKAFWHNEAIWKVFQQAASSEWARNLPPHRRHLVHNVMQRFRDEGIELPSEQRTRLTAITKELLDLSQQFSSNLLDSRHAWKFDLTPYAHLEDIDTLNFEHESNRRIIRLDQAYVILYYFDDDQLREAVWQALQTIGKTPHDNGPVIERILSLRHEQARILGYASYADFVASHNMMKTSEAAEQHIRSILQYISPQYETILESMRQAKAEHTGNTDAILNPWDTAYYMMQLAAKQAPFNSRELAQGLPAQYVFPRIFAIFSELYGITITECPAVFMEPGNSRIILPGTAEVWAPGVRYYEVRDKADGRHLGSFYIDGNSRPGKKPGAWTCAIGLGNPPTAQSPSIPHYAAVITNSPASGNLFHSDIVSYFHEFGHILHWILTDIDSPSFYNYGIEPDFIEFPSTLHEKLAWDPEILARISEPAITEELYAALISRHRFLAAYDSINAYHQALIDLELHRHYEQYAGKNLDTIEREIMHKNSFPFPDIGSYQLRSNQHLFAGLYAGVYYAYVWDNLLAEDAFTRFREKGLTNPAIGAEFRRTILSKGSTKPAAELYRDFMGRDPKPDALLQSLGIKPQKEIPSDAKTR